MNRSLPEPLRRYYATPSLLERDACGVGFVADLHGRRSHRILRQAIEAVKNCTHRGACSADGKSGDGAGVLTQIPRRLLMRHLRESAREALGRPEDLAVAMLFLPQAEAAATFCRNTMRDTLVRAGFTPLATREVPVDREQLGEFARRTCPRIEQLLVARPSEMPDDECERALYHARRCAERAALQRGIADFYVPSCSARTVVYKGLMVAPQLDRFFLDLADPEYETAIAVFHQRYSTNTFPTWFLAQPFRFLAHNGEINTLQGNVNWMAAREPELQSPLWLRRLKDLFPIIQKGGSDSAMLDNVLELLVNSGRGLLHAMMMLVPEAYQQSDDLDEEIRACFEYHATIMEPWDGPAFIAFSDGLTAAATLDRNGLRPARYWVARDGTVIVGSEAGLVRIPQRDIVAKGRLGPGQMIAVDTERQALLTNETIKREIARRQPYRAWISTHMIRPHEIGVPEAASGAVDWSGEELVRRQKCFGYGSEDLDRILTPMLLESKEPVGAMGDDTPLAVLSEKPQLLYRYFKQRFAQVTNPPIDPLRERLVMSLNTAVGPRACLLDEVDDAARLIKFQSPILTTAEFGWLRRAAALDPRFAHREIDCTFPVAEGPEGLATAVERICQEAEAAVDAGCSLLILTDRAVGPERAPVPMLLAVGVTHHHLIRAGKRMRASIVCDTGEPREDHHFACLIGYGAALIHPYLAYRSVADLAESGRLERPIDPEQALANYRAAIEKGLLKIMSKMGISTISSYRGAQIFEAVGVSRDLIRLAFAGTETRVEGIGLTELAIDVLRFHAEGYHEEPVLRERGIYRYRKGGEYHSFNPEVFTMLHRAVRKQDPEAYREYARRVDERPPCNLRDLLQWKRAPQPLPLSEVEPAESIARRFCTQAMSHGALSREAHEVLAIAMNRLGAKSNSGEGGEDRERFYPYEREMPEKSLSRVWHPKAGDWGNSAIKQVASGRFGVTPEYLVCARELEIKMAQGSKPGEGGQIPGLKVSEEIARIRHSVPGVTLISPPPHHDIYSIEDLAQLIYDLKRVNPDARVCVKLVAEMGVGTVAAGVAKGYADSIQISGHDGGTGASPISSIKHAGLPWELGLAETQQVLVLNDLRGRVLLRVDGGLKTGRDVVMAALLGAEEFGFGTAAVVASGCVLARTCHLNNCPVGIATQNPELRAKFAGQPEHVIAFFLYVAEQVRHILAEMGFRRLEEIIGRTDLLEPRPLPSLPKTQNLDLSFLLADPDPSGTKPRRRVQERNDRPEPVPPLDQVVFEDCQAAIVRREPVVRSYEIRNTERSVGARLSGAIARAWRDEGLPDGTIRLHFKGSAGQSFGAFCNRGMHLYLEGEAQDYVGKSMYGGEIVIVPPADAPIEPHESTIMGNTVLYGATGGALYAAGRAGERLCVRNSGARAVVEGCGDHGCEYMTNGVVVILGETGRNFGAGMSGGVAYVYDEADRFPSRYNPGMVSIQRITPDADDGDVDEALLRAMIERHFRKTGSRRAEAILANWDEALPRFWKVVPHPSAEEKTARDQDLQAIERVALEAVLREPAGRLIAV